MIKHLLPVLAILAIVSGCKEPTSPNEYDNRLVVSGFLIEGEMIDTVMVQRTARIDEFFSSDAVAIPNARVVVSGNGIVDTLRYDPSSPGRYYSVNASNVIRPLTTYALRIEAPGYPVVSGSTTVPDPIRILNRDLIPVALQYNSAPIGVQWSRCSQYADYVGSVTSRDTLAPKIRRRVTDVDTTEPPDRTSFMFGFYDMTSTEIPWFAFNYYGSQRIAISAIDSNYSACLGQATVGGIDVKDMRYALKGGLGVFGSASRDTITIMVTP